MSMETKEVLITNACVITGDGPVYNPGFIHIRDGIIVEVGKNQPLVTEQTIKGTTLLRDPIKIDAGGRYVCPGFINPHMHLYSALARGMPVGRMKTFGEVLKKLWWKLDEKLTLEDIYISALLGGIDSIKSGTTTLFDHHASYGAISESLSAVSRGLTETGVRASLCYEISDRVGKLKRDEAIEESARWIGEAKSPMRHAMVGLHAAMTLSDETLKIVSKLMDEHGVSAHVHVAEGIEDVKAVTRLAKHGILRKGTFAVHCIHVDSRDISILKKSGVTVIHNPHSNLNNAVGVMPFFKMLKRKIPVAIGTDGMSASPANDIQIASVLHKIAKRDAQAGGLDVCNAVWGVTPQIASGAFGVKLGCIEKNAAADVIIVDSLPPTDVTRDNAWWHVLFGVLNSSVRTTIINGVIRMRDFEFVGIDEKTVAGEAKILAKRLWKSL